jgi:hypothetical protein
MSFKGRGKGGRGARAKRGLGMWRVGELELVLELVGGAVVAKLFSRWYPRRRLVWTETYRRRDVHELWFEVRDAFLREGAVPDELAPKLLRVLDEAEARARAALGA